MSKAIKRIPVAEATSNVLSLPRLPVPALADTASRYRAAVTAVRAPASEAVKNHFARLDDFLATSGPVLQKALLDRDAAAIAANAAPFSYFEGVVQEQALASRAPLEVNMNAGFILKKELAGLKGGPAPPPPSPSSAAAAASPEAVAAKNKRQAFVAGSFAYGIGRWIAEARAQGIAVADPPVDVSPLVSEFGRSLIPGVASDAQHTTPFEKLRHVVVLHDGHPFCVRLFSDAGALLPRAELCAAMELVLSITPDRDNTAPVSVLTAGGRAVWGQAYQELIRSPENAAALAKFHESALVICLDNAEWGEGAGGEANSVAGALAMHGAREELENRWYDKHQLIVSGDGQVAFNFEQTSSERVQWARWIDDVLTILEADAAAAPPPAAVPAAAAAAAAAHVEPLIITYGKSFATHIRTARAEALEVVSETEVKSFSLPYGRRALGTVAGVSPNAFVQLCLLLTQYKARERLVPTSELRSVAGFFHGGTELVRSATAEAASVGAAIEKYRRNRRSSSATAAGEGEGEAETTPLVRYRDLPPLLSSEERAEMAGLIKAALAKHVALTAEASRGAGIDRHLAALHHVAVNNKDKAALAFFEDPVFVSGQQYAISTSEFSRPWLAQNICGPAGPDGYGIGYVIDEEETRVSLSDFINSPASDSAELQRLAGVTAETLYHLLTGSKI